MRWRFRKCIFAVHMRLWIALFLITLFAIQALPVLALGKSCVKTQAGAAGTADGENGEDGDVPGTGKLKKAGASFEEYDLASSWHTPGQLSGQRTLPTYAPMVLRAAATGHTRLHTPPPDRH